MIAKLGGRARKLAKVLTNSGYRRALARGGVAAAIEHEAILRTLSCATVVDIGANRGQFALVSRACFPQARIISFEPLAGPAERYRRVLGDDANVLLHQVAIGDTPGEATIHVSAADDSSSLLPITGLQNTLFSGTHEVRTETIRVERLGDQLTAADIGRPALLKIDVQGYELSTLRGCESLLGEFDFLYVECSFVELYEGQALAADVIDYLGQRAFALRGTYNVYYDRSGRSIQADLLFTPAKATAAGGGPAGAHKNRGDA